MFVFKQVRLKRLHGSDAVLERQVAQLRQIVALDIVKIALLNSILQKKKKYFVSATQADKRRSRTSVRGMTRESWSGNAKNREMYWMHAARLARGIPVAVTIM